MGKGVLREQGRRQLEVEPEHAHDSDEAEDRDHLRTLADVDEALADRALAPSRAFADEKVLLPYGAQTGDSPQERHGVDEEDPRPAGGWNEQTSHGRAEDARRVECRRVEP